MKQFLKMVGASLKMTYREKVALFWMFLFPVLMMLLLGAIFGNTGQANITIGVVDLDNSVISKQIVAGLQKIKAFDVKVGTKEEQFKRLTDGKNNAVLVLDKGFMETIQGGNPGEALVYVDKSSPTTADITYSTVSQVINQMIKEMARQYNPALVPPDLVTVKQETVTSEELSYVDYIVPGILALTIMQAGVMGLALDFVSVRERGILRRIKVSPVPLSRYLGGEISASLVMALIQAAVLLLVGWLVFRIHVRGNPLYVLILVLLGALSFLALGFLIASLSKTLKTAQMASNAISFPMMFLAGVFFPLAILPNFLVVIAKFMPLYYLGHALRQVMILGRGLGAVWVDIVVLASFGLVCFALSLKWFRWE